MAYTLGNKCAKNICKWTVLLQLIFKNVVTCFLEHSVEGLYGEFRKSRLRPSTKFEVRRPSRSEDTAHLVCQPSIYNSFPVIRTSIENKKLIGD